MSLLPESEEIEMDQLPAQMQRILQQAQMMFNTGPQDSEPMAYVFGHNNTYAAFAVKNRFEDDDNKLRFGTEMAMLTCNQNIVAISVFTEANMLQQQLDAGQDFPSGDINTIMQQLLASGQVPDVCEVAIVMYEDREYSYTSIARIHHNEDHTERYLDHWQTMRGAQEAIQKMDRDKMPALQGTFAKAALMYEAMLQEDRQEKTSET